MAASQLGPVLAFEKANKILTDNFFYIKDSIAVTKLNPKAEIPFKEGVNDPFYQLTVIDRCDNRAEDTYADVNSFTTGIKIQPPNMHYHIEISAHPDLHRAGYMMVNSPLCIQWENDQEIVLELYKYKQVDDLELPFKAAIMLVRQSEHAPLAIPAENARNANGRPTKTKTTSFRYHQQKQPAYEEDDMPPPPAPKGKGKQRQHMF